MLPTLSEIDKYWKKNANYKMVGDLAYEIIKEEKYNHCYACGIKCTPQRCHILADALGGGEECSNIFLLCGECHKDNPDTIWEETFFQYVRTRGLWLGNQLEDMEKDLNKITNIKDRKVLDDIDVDIEDLKAILETSKEVVIMPGGVMSSMTKASLLLHKVLR